MDENELTLARLLDIMFEFGVNNVQIFEYGVAPITVKDTKCKAWLVLSRKIGQKRVRMFSVNVKERYMAVYLERFYETLQT